MLHQGGWDRSDPCGGNWIPGNSRLCSSVEIPSECGDDWLNTKRLLGASISKGRCHQYQGSVGDGSDWYTGIQSSHGVINLHFVYTLVTVFICL